MVLRAGAGGNKGWLKSTTFHSRFERRVTWIEQFKRKKNEAIGFVFILPPPALFNFYSTFKGILAPFTQKIVYSHRNPVPQWSIFFITSSLTICSCSRFDASSLSSSSSSPALHKNFKTFFLYWTMFFQPYLSWNHLSNGPKHEEKRGGVGDL